jgi:hypothetical protein
LLIKNCITAKLAPVTKHAGHTASMPRQPTCAATSQNGTSSENTGNCRPTIALSDMRSRPVMSAIVVSGMPSDPNATGAVLPMSASFRRFERFEAQPDHERPRDRHRRAKTRRAFDEGAKAKRDHQRLDASITRNTGDLPLQHRELPVSTLRL